VAVRQRLNLRAERRRLARDLHDGLGSGVHRLQRLTELLNQVSPDSPEAVRYRDELLRSAQELGGSLDRTIWAIKPENDTLEGFADYLAGYATCVVQSNGLAFDFDQPSDLPRRTLPGEARQHLLLAVNEALNNIMKHAHASRVRLALECNDSTLTILVEDDGRGFDRNSTTRRAMGGNGLSNLHERLQSLGGTAEIGPRPEGGTRVCLRLPL
jgi:two-component system sensor histidine kinase DesK